jgi:hypothetical protein
MKPGDAIATVAQPIAHGIDRLFGTDVANCSGCNRMKNNLNAGMNLSEAIFDRFWPQTNKETNNAVRDNEADSSGS